MKHRYVVHESHIAHIATEICLRIINGYAIIGATFRHGQLLMLEQTTYINR